MLHIHKLCSQMEIFRNEVLNHYLITAYSVCWHLYQLSRDETMVANMEGITEWLITDQFQLFNLCLGSP